MWPKLTNCECACTRVRRDGYGVLADGPISYTCTHASLCRPEVGNNNIKTTANFEVVSFLTDISFEINQTTVTAELGRNNKLYYDPRGRQKAVSFGRRSGLYSMTTIT